MNENNVVFETDHHFTSAVYRLNKKEFIGDVKPVFDDFVEKNKSSQQDTIHPVVMTDEMLLDPRLSSFIEFVSELAWDILDSQGYDMNLFYTKIDSIWGQRHDTTSGMDYHTHSNTVLSGFYFLEVPENSSNMMIHDPRPAKVFASLPIKQNNEYKIALDSVYYTPKPGDLILTNAWLPHSFTRNRSDSPFNFVHINIGVIPKQLYHGENDPIVV